MQHALLDNLPANMFPPLRIFLPSWKYQYSFPVTILPPSSSCCFFSCFSMSTQREKHTVFSFRQRIILLFLLASRTINIPFKNSSITHLWTSCSKTAAEQPDLADALAVCPIPLSTEFDTKNRLKQQQRIFWGDRNQGTWEWDCIKKY